MERILSKNLKNFIGQKVLVKGWMNNVRELGKINFLILRDRKGFMQIVIEDKAEYEKIRALQPGSILYIKADVQETTQTEIGVELINPEIHVEVKIESVPSIEYTKPEIKADLETILDHRPIALRNRKISAVFKIQGEIARPYREYMRNEVGAVEYFGPSIIGTSSEGGSEFFTVDYFDQKATLAQSSQLYKQIMVGVAERTFAIMPFFRAENSNTVRHLTEGKQLEFEMGFFENWKEIMDVEEGAIKFIVAEVKKNCEDELKYLDFQIIDVPIDKPFPRVTFKQAQEIYFKRTGTDDRNENDLSPTAEKELCQYAKEEYGTDCIFITDWLTGKRPFYSYVNDENPEITNTFDLLCAGTEITSGGQRCHEEKSLIDGLNRKGMNPANFEDYLSIFRFGMPPHGGFGLGLERLTMTILKLKNIREASLFPSDPKRIAGIRIKSQIVFGAENIRNEIISKIRNAGFEFEHAEHEPTPTSIDSAKVRGTKQSEGIKALILVGKTTKQNYQVNIPAHVKADMSKIAEKVGEKCEFEKPEIIESRYGLVIGGIPPFGNLMGLPVYFDSKILDEERAAFNCGLQTESIIMKSKDLVELVKPEMGDFSK